VPRGGRRGGPGAAQSHEACQGEGEGFDRQMQERMQAGTSPKESDTTTPESLRKSPPRRSRSGAKHNRDQIAAQAERPRPAGRR